MTGWPLFHSYDLSYGLIFAAGVMLAVGIRLGGLILARRTRKPVSQTAIRHTARTISAAPLVLLFPAKIALQHSHLPTATIECIELACLGAAVMGFAALWESVRN